MSDRPMLFSGPMVRALLDGRKTQTRRLMVPQPGINSAGLLTYEARGVSAQGSHETIAMCLQIGIRDRLWVKEALVRDTTDQDVAFKRYAADNAKPAFIAGGWHWKVKTLPSMYMPRAFSRLTLHVTDVRVQRVQDISVGDAEAEGALVPPYPPEFAAVHAVPMYRAIWNGINGEGSWETNPFVAATTFVVERANIDSASMPA